MSSVECKLTGSVYSSDSLSVPRPVAHGTEATSPTCYIHHLYQLRPHKIKYFFIRFFSQKSCKFYLNILPLKEFSNSKFWWIIFKWTEFRTHRSRSRSRSTLRIYCVLGCNLETVIPHQKVIIWSCLQISSGSLQQTSDLSPRQFGKSDSDE